MKVDDQPIDIKVSLKAGDVKQFGQVSGAEFAKQEKLWETTFGYGKRSSNCREASMMTLDDSKQAAQAVSLVYQQGGWISSTGT